MIGLAYTVFRSNHNKPFPILNWLTKNVVSIKNNLYWESLGGGGGLVYNICFHILVIYELLLIDLCLISLKVN